VSSGQQQPVSKIDKLGDPISAKFRQFLGPEEKGLLLLHVHQIIQSACLNSMGGIFFTISGHFENIYCSIQVGHDESLDFF
jgi:hypothetical protein